MVSINSWEYPTKFLVLQPKANLNGYPLILGSPSLAIIDAYISCRARNITIKSGHISKYLVLYAPAQPSLEHDLPLWLEEEEEDEVYSSQLYTLETTMGEGQLDEDDLIEHIVQSPTPSTLSLEEVVKET